MESLAMMQKINQAYNTLSNAALRSQYDLERGFGAFKGQGGVHADAMRRQRAHNAKTKKADEAKKKGDEAMKRARQKAEEATRKTAKKTSQKKSSQTSGQSQEAPKEPPKNSEPKYKRAFNPNKPCPVCWGNGGLRVAQGFQTAKVVCPQCEGIGSQ